MTMILIYIFSESRQKVRNFQIAIGKFLAATSCSYLQQPSLSQAPNKSQVPSPYTTSQVPSTLLHTMVITHYTVTHTVKHGHHTPTTVTHTHTRSHYTHTRSHTHTVLTLHTHRHTSYTTRPSPPPPSPPPRPTQHAFNVYSRTSNARG